MKFMASASRSVLFMNEAISEQRSSQEHRLLLRYKTGCNCQEEVLRIVLNSFLVLHRNSDLTLQNKGIQCRR
jgi:hypothetical protein